MVTRNQKQDSTNNGKGNGNRNPLGSRPPENNKKLRSRPTVRNEVQDTNGKTEGHDNREIKGGEHQLDELEQGRQ